MKAALQLVSTGGMYGAERVLLELANYVQSHGWQSHVVAIDGGGADAVVSAARVRGLEATQLSAGATSVASQARAMAQYVEAHDIDVVHSHGYKPSVLMSVMAQTRARVRIATCHGWLRGSAKLRLYEYLEKRALRGFDAVVAVSPEIRAKLARAGVQTDRLHLIANGLDATAPRPFARASVRRELGIPDQCCLLVCIGRLDAAKGNSLLLRAVAKLPADCRDWSLAIVGDGAEREHLPALARQLGLSPRVTFLGYRSDIADMLAAADVFVLPSLMEGLPMVLLEAMAATRAIVATTVGAIPDVVADDAQALLVAPGDVDGLVTAVGRFLADPELRARLGGAAAQRHQTSFSRAVMGRLYLDLYEGLYTAATSFK
jgi:glycosyltransferase involved in cell wall biosynthesis